MADKRIFQLTEASQVDDNDMFVIDRTSFQKAKSVTAQTIMELVPSEVFTINITTTESTLYGQTVTATYDSDKTKTAVFSNAGTATIKIANYEGNITLTATDGTNTATGIVTTVSGTATYSISLDFAKIYGISWDGGSSSAWTRTDAAELFSDPSPAVNNGNGSSPFDSILPWSGMEIVDDASAGKLVKIPKYYYKWTKTGAAMTLQISSESFSGSHVSPAHADRGDGAGERDFVYVGRYHCSSTNYKSVSGATPIVNLKRSVARLALHNNFGSDVWQWDFRTYWTILMLYLVEYADWNSQAKIGYGCGNGSSAAASGSTDAMEYHTGTNAANRTTYGHIQYRHIEDIWGNVFTWVDGIRFSGVDVIITDNPANFSDTTEGTKVGERATSNNNDIKSYNVPSLSGYEWALYPSEVISDNTFSTYVCDRCIDGSAGQVLCVGGDFSQDQSYGLFRFMGHFDNTLELSTIGARLMKLPN